MMDPPMLVSVCAIFLIGGFSTCVAGAEPTLYRCAQDNAQNPVFMATPGNIKREALSASNCSLACFLMKHAWAGLQRGAFCLCSNQPQAAIDALPAVTNCTMSCPLGNATCGGLNGITSIYSSSAAATISLPQILYPVTVAVDGVNNDTAANFSLTVSKKLAVLEQGGVPASGLPYSIQFGDKFPPRPMNSNVSTDVFPQPIGIRTLSVAGIWKGPAAYATPPLVKRTLSITGELSSVTPIIRNVTCDTTTPVILVGTSRLCKISVYLPTSSPLTFAYSVTGSNFPVGAWAPWVGRAILASDTGYAQNSSTRTYGPIRAPGNRERILGGWTGVDLRPADDYLYATETNFILAASRFPSNVYKAFEILLQKVSNTSESVTVELYRRVCPGTAVPCPETTWCLPTTVNYTSQPCAASALNASSGYCASVSSSSSAKSTLGGLLSSGTIQLAPNETGKMVKLYSFASGVFADAVKVTSSSAAVRFAYRPPRPQEETDEAASGQRRIFVARALPDQIYHNVDIPIPCNTGVYSGISAVSFSVSTGAGGPNQTFVAGSAWDCQIPIVGVRVVLNTTKAAVNDKIQYNITITAGSPAAFRVINALPGQNVTLWIPDARKTAVGIFSYNKSLDYTYIQAEAYNLFNNATPLLSPLEVTNGFVVQWPVKTGAWNVSIPTTSGGIYQETDNVTFTLTYTGIPGEQATNVSVRLDFGDGTLPVILNITNGATSTTMQPHKYNSGIYNASATVYNLVSNVTFYGTMGGLPAVVKVVAAASDISAQFMYQPTPVDPLQFGSGPDRNQVPSEVNISLVPTVGSGYVEYFLVYWQNGTLIQRTNVTNASNAPTTNPVLLPNLPEGEYGFVVDACFSGTTCIRSTMPITLFIDSGLYGLTIDDYGEVTPPMQVKGFTLNFESIGTSTCILIDWGDSAVTGNNSMETIGEQSTCSMLSSGQNAPYNPNVTVRNPMTISHNYTTEGVYNLSVVAWNTETSTTASIIVVSTNISCTSPGASIVEPPTGMQFQRSVQTILDGRYTINCASKVDARFRWNLYEQNETTGEIIWYVDIKNWTTWNRSQLVIPALSLPFGFYKLQFTVFLDGSPVFDMFPIQKSVFTEFQITKTPLVCLIYDGGVSKILKGSQDLVFLKPGILSFDPDDPIGASAWPVRYEWSCSREGEPNALNSTTLTKIPTANYSRNFSNDLGGCFGKGPVKLDINSSTYNLDVKTLYKPNTTYTITVRMLKDDRITDSALDIQILSGNSSPLDVLITCVPESSCRPPSVSGLLINLDGSRLMVRGVCQKGCDDSSMLSYQWSVTIDKGPLGLEAIPANATGKFPYGTSNQDLVLSGQFFADLSAVSPAGKFRIRLTIINAKSGVYGFSEMYMTVNKPPSGGSCQCTASSYPFIAIKTILKCTCSNWTDPEGMGIESFQFVAKRLDITTHLEQVVLAPSAQPEFQFVPVPGSYEITCTIADTAGASIVAPVTIIVNSIDPASSKPIPIMSSSFQMVAPTAQELQDMQDSGMIDALLGLNPALEDMITAVNMSVMASSLTAALSAVEVTGSTGTNATSSTKAAIDTALSRISAALDDAAASLTTKNMATPEQMSSTASAMAALVTTVTGAEGKAAAAISSNFLDAATSIFQSIADSLDTNLNTMPRSTLESLAIAAMTMIDTVGSTLGPMVAEGCAQKPPNPDMTTCPSAERNNVFLDAAPLPLPVGYVAPVDPDIEKCCLVLQEKARGLGSMTTTVFNTLGKLTDILTKAVGEKEFVAIPTAPGTAVQVSKQSSANLLGLAISVLGSTVKLPAVFASSALSSSTSVAGIQAIAMDNVPLRGENVGNELNSPDGSMLTFDLMDANGKKIILDNLLAPIQISMSRNFTPRLIEEIEATIRYINVSAGYQEAFGGIIYTTINGSAHATFVAVYIRMEDASIAPDGLHLMVGRGLKPSPIKGMYDPNLVAQVKTLPRDADGYHVYIGLFDELNDEEIHVGVFELKSGLTVAGVANQSNWDNLRTFFLGNFTKAFYIRVTDGSVNYFDAEKQSWVSDPDSKPSAIDNDGIQFKTTHLGTFGSGLLVKPNLVDFSSVFAKAGFTDNLTIYMTLIITSLIYVTILLWARRKDQLDVRMIGALPLPDNKLEAKYIYEILTVTGDQNSAATTSQIFFVLSGERDNTGIRTFGKPTKSPRPFFTRGGTDAFVMAVDGPLGDLTYMRIWNDCSGSGKLLSWYCSSISIRDVQTGARHDFVVNSWFSPSDDDCEVDRLIGIASEEDRKQFNYLFETQKTRNLRDGHLWFSIFTRPPRSRFTRVQRVSTCMALLYLSMLANAMWYGTVPDQPGPGAMKFGPFAISQEQIGVGVMANLVVLPPSLLIVFLFRKARPRKLRKSRIDQALKNQREVIEAKGKGILPKKRRFTLPWWCAVVAWVLCISCMVISAFFLWAYGVTFGDDKCTKWISSLIIGFFSSILFVQPLKVLAIAILCSAVFKFEVEVDDADEDEEDPTLQWDEAYLVDDFEQRHRKRIPSAAVGVDSTAIKALKEKRMKERKMWEAIKKLIFYTTYIWIMIIISYNNRDPNATLLRRNMEKVFITTPRANGFSEVKDLNAFWDWVKEVLLGGLRAKKWYNGDEAIGLQGFMADFNNRMIGYAIMRQIRVQENSCVVPKEMRAANFTTCSNLADINLEDKTDYCTQWRERSSAIADSLCDWPEFKYSKASDFESLPYIGRLDSYSGGGYTFIFQGREREIRARLDELRQQAWLDARTRAVVVEFAAYNAQVNLFTVAKIVVEAVPGGGLIPAWRFDGIRLMRYYEGFSLVSMVCEAAFAVFTIYFTVVAVRALCSDRKAFFSSYWSYVEIMQLALSYTAIVFYVVRSFMTDSVTKQFAETMGNSYIPMQHVAYVDSVFGYLFSILVFASTLSLLKILRFNKSIGDLSATMKICFDELRGFGFVFAVFLAAFVILFHLILFQHLYDWRTILASFETSFQIMLGKFEFGEITETNQFAGIAFFFFNVAMSIIMINLLMTIIITSFEEAKIQVSKDVTDFEIMELMIERIKKFVGLSKQTGQRQSSAVRPVAYDHKKLEQMRRPNDGTESATLKELPQKLDEMLDQINNVYFDGTIELQDRFWLRRLIKRRGYPGDAKS